MEETLNLHNDINEIPLLGEWVEALGEKLKLPMASVFQLNLALEEAVVNVMNYAYPGEKGKAVVLRAHGDGSLVTFVLEDEGVEFDPTKAEDPDVSLDISERPIGGLGIFLVRQYMSEVKYVRDAGRNILTMTYKPDA